MKKSTYLLVLAWAVFCQGCDDPSKPKTHCLPIAYASLRVSVFDAVSGDPVIDPLVWVRDGNFVDTLPVGGHEAFGPVERPGVYHIWVEKPGYATWDTSGVVVSMMPSGCNVIQVPITARLEPLGPG
jgi:hypothetical protein